MSGRFSGAPKFRAKWTRSEDGTNHPSKGEAKWWDKMRLLERAKVITNLIARPRWKVYVARDCPHCRDHGEYIGYVEGDGQFTDADGVEHFVDYKGGEGETPLSKFKRRFVAARFGIDIELVGPEAKRSAQAKAKKSALARRGKS